MLSMAFINVPNLTTKLQSLNIVAQAFWPIGTELETHKKAREENFIIK
tara:strand:+ start:384 stop:527 length:144 start_codon:yes stop_codon:yes gene_type:complete